MSKLKYLSVSEKEKISDFPKKFNELLGIVERLIYAVSLIGSFVITPILNNLFSAQISYVLIFLNIVWNQLSEGYQILFLGAPIAIICEIAAYIIIRKFIGPLLEKEK